MVMDASITGAAHYPSRAKEPCSSLFRETRLQAAGPCGLV